MVAFVFMLIGLFDFGQVLFIHQALTERARNAARWGVVNDPTDTTSIQNMVLYNQSTVPASGSAFLGMTSSMVQVSNPDTGTDDNRIVVLITGYPYTVFSPYIGGTYSGPNITVIEPVGN